MEEFDDEHLISLVSKYRVIFDKTDPNFKNKEMRKNAWVTISEILNNGSAEDCEKRFTVLRNKYGAEKRNLQNQEVSGMGAFPESTWPLYRQMGFLDKHMFTRKRSTRTNISMSSSSGTSDRELLSPTQGNTVWDTMSQVLSPQSEPQSEPENTALSDVGSGVGEPTTSSGATQQSQSNKRKKGSEKNVNSFDETLLAVKQFFSEKTKSVSVQSLPSQSVTKSFAQTVEQMLEGIRNRKRRRRVQAKIMSILAETDSGSEDSD